MKLKVTQIWPKGDQNMKIQRFVASDLHVPSSLFRELGLPILDWKKRWACNTLEGILVIYFFTIFRIELLVMKIFLKKKNIFFFCRKIFN